jgi:hypothetical protein
VEWNYGQADRERLHVQDYNEKAKIEHAALAAILNESSISSSM